MLEIRSVEKTFESTRVLTPINLSIDQGDFFSILGPSGCGKTTLLRIIAGFEFPDHGTIKWKGADLHGAPAHQRPFNMIFQKYALFPHLTVKQNIEFGPSVKGWSKLKIQEEVDHALKLVQLESFAQRSISSLSGGQQQRVAIARAIVNKPEILLLDEPLSALDKKLREHLQIDLLRIQRSLGITFIMVTHDQEEALTMSDKIAVMNHGVIEQFGTPHDIYRRPKTRFVADFIGNVNVVELDGRSIGVRPEDLRIAREPFVESVDYSPSYEGVVREVMFKGAVTDVVFESFLGGHQSKQWMSQILSTEQSQWDVGQRVFARWSHGQAMKLEV